MAVSTTCRVFRPDPRALDVRETHQRGVFCAHHPMPSTVVVTVEGEIDATNSRMLCGYIERQVAGSSHLVLDLRLVDFFGTDGFAALHNINMTCSRYGMTWTVRAGRQVRRLLMVCDHDGVLPVEESRSVLDEVGTLA
ncbi:STAS domain-containing protein [Mycolicibacterium sp. XJ1819]